MGEPRRWVLVEVEPAAMAVWPHMSPEAQAAVRSPMPTRTVREDRATEADIEAVTERLFLRRYPELEWRV